MSKHKLIAQVFWVYHLLSGGIGLFFLSPIFYLSLRSNNLIPVLSVMTFVFFDSIFLVGTYAFLKGRKWGYYCVVLFYAIQIVQLPKYYLQLTLFHVSIDLSIFEVNFGIELISLFTLVLLLLVKPHTNTDNR